MGQTMTEKILSAHAGKQVESGEYTTLCVDLAYVQDGTGPLAGGLLARTADVGRRAAGTQRAGSREGAEVA